MIINKNSVKKMGSNGLINQQKMVHKVNTSITMHSNNINRTMQINNTPIIQSQSGFTLIELMISILLGVLVIAAAVSILISSTQTSRIQDASSSIQDSIVFPISQLKEHIRRANYGSLAGNKTGYFLSHDTPQAGIVLTAPSVTTPPVAGAPVLATTNLNGLKLGTAVIDSSYLTRPDHSDSNITGQKNDQLTIQYQMPKENRFDCQGREIPKKYYVIERYFIRDDNGSKALACASANYAYDDIKAKNYDIDISKYGKVTTSATGTKTVSSVVSNFDGNGTVLIPNVDYFRVLFNVTTQSKFATAPDNLKMKFIPPAAKPATAFNGLRIAGIQIGMILRSGNTTMSGPDNAEQKFNVLDKSNLELTTDAKNGAKYMRDSYETSILIRNARGTK